ncbi:hypothetical protein GX865_00855 [Candidatus Saccharibacteria bacterium]|jgi:hypothetical protein|nr:hypothetical protein [Candidatus Saccharibacteria bacterium]
MIPEKYRIRHEARKNRTPEGYIFDNTMFKTRLDQMIEEGYPNSKLVVITLRYTNSLHSKEGELDVVIRKIRKRPLYENFYSHSITVSDGYYGEAEFGVLPSGRINLRSANLRFRAALKKGFA